MKVHDVWDYYKNDLTLAEAKIKENLNIVAPAISAVGQHLLMSGGKRIRPILVILCSKIFGYSGEKTSILACSAESIHTASLLHDDIVDGADMRRGEPTAHSLWGSQVVVLVGDYLYSNALRLINSLESQKIMDAFTQATAMMSEGELIQLSKKEQTTKGNFTISEEDYIKIIVGKTAILMSASCKGGAVIGNANQEQENALTTFGLKFGMAFQIADDILDYMAEENILGKNLGKDIKEGKITLPLIYLLRDASEKEVKKVKSVIQSEKLTDSDLSCILELLEKYRSIKQAYTKAQNILEEAKGKLDIFEDSHEKASLLTISDYALTRGK
ncbi:MAG: polyprenyl synthetase family protein [Nitrospiraceae bacterium]|nr:MAG: polyprenyl synthetase family protein [Nitrospiraceae bacterium]